MKELKAAEVYLVNDFIYMMKEVRPSTSGLQAGALENW